MSTVVPFESASEKIASSIEQEISGLTRMEPLKLPSPDHRLVSLSVERIQGEYNVAYAKVDTDNAVDLLHIAYSSTPQRHGEIRVEIDKIVNDLIRAQQDSVQVMNRAIRTSREINGLLEDLFPRWLNVRSPFKENDGNDNDIAKLSSFVQDRLAKVARTIADRATATEADLLKAADTYDAIIVKAEKATQSSELALSTNIKDREALQREINKNNAQRAKLDKLVEELSLEVKKFEAKARDFEKRASTAEDRAFVLSIIGAAASVVAAVVPPIAMLASSGMVGAATRGAATVAASQNRERTDNEAKTKTAIADKKAEQEELQDEVAKLEKNIEELEAKRKPEDDENTSQELTKRIDERQKELDRNKEKLSRIDAALTKLQEGLDKTASDLEQLSKKHSDQAGDLRALQMQMLDKAEKYETERRTQAAELVRIKVLLEGQQSQEETLQLAVKSLDLSIGALKRMQEIVREMAFFFKSFADFMADVSDNSRRQLAKFQDATTEDLRDYLLHDLLRSTDIFFVKQTADWHAVNKVSNIFMSGFSGGATRLIKLSGHYLTGAALKEFLNEAGGRLEAIARERENRSDARIIMLKKHRDSLELDAA